jgi:hypothetical protein
MRNLNIQEYFLEELNRMLAAEGRDVRIVADHSRPRLAEIIVFDREKRDQQDKAPR